MNRLPGPGLLRAIGQASADWLRCDDLRPCDRLLAHWVLAHGGSPALAAWAAALGRAEGEGHTALERCRAADYGLAIEDPALQAALDDGRWVADAASLAGDPAARPRAFVKDGAERLYSWRLWHTECRVAAALAQLAGSRNPPAAATLEVEGLFDGPEGGPDAEQREAVRRCTAARLFVLGGGPGTGKTSTVLRMLLAHQAGWPEARRLALLAPTGKAAQRLAAALRQGREALARSLAGSVWATALATLVLPEPQTVHRLLGLRPGGRSLAGPLELDLVVVDEASMLDLERLAALLDALPAGAALWLIGDAGQLSPVGPGSVLSDLLPVLDRCPVPPRVELRHGFRADAGLAALHAALRAGDLAASLAALEGSPRVLLEPLAELAALAVAQARWAQTLAAETPPTRLPADPAAAREVAGHALAALRRRQWLCALREGPWGSHGVNAGIDAALAAGQPVHGTGHYPGRRLLITRNDPDTGLANGDVGICLETATGELRAWFEFADGLRCLPVAALPPCEPAWALTIHKSQGSEYDEVAVLLPPDPGHRLLSRELLYTAATRAKHGLRLHASVATLAASLARPIQRIGGLHRRLAAAMEAQSGG